MNFLIYHGEIISKAIALIANILTAIASGIAIFIFLAKRNEIAAIYRLLKGYAILVSLNELNRKLEDLNDLDAADPSDQSEAVNIFNDIMGQLAGNSVISNRCTQVSSRIERAVRTPSRLTEPLKRRLISELRETLRHLEIEMHSNNEGAQ